MLWCTGSPRAPPRVAFFMFIMQFVHPAAAPSKQTNATTKTCIISSDRSANRKTPPPRLTSSTSNSGAERKRHHQIYLSITSFYCCPTAAQSETLPPSSFPAIAPREKMPQQPIYPRIVVPAVAANKRHHQDPNCVQRRRQTQTPPPRSFITCQSNIFGKSLLSLLSFQIRCHQN